MRFPTNLLNIFGSHNGSISPGDAVMTVPNTLLPMVSIGEPYSIIADFAASTSGVSGTTSFMVSSNITRTNQAQAFINLIVVPPGIWQLQMAWQFCNSNASAQFQCAKLFLFDQVLLGTFVVARAFGGSSPWHGTHQLDITIPVGSTVLIETDYAITGVGETTQGLVSVNGRRLG